MPNPVIPSGFDPQVQGYSIGSPGGVLATEVAGGAPRVGLDYDRGPQPFQVTLILEPNEFNVWTAWFHHIVKKGAITFDMQLDSGFGPQTHACTMVPNTYAAVPVGGMLRSVSFVVSAENRVYDMTAVDAQGMVDLWEVYGLDYADLLDRLAQFATSDTNVLEV